MNFNRTDIIEWLDDKDNMNHKIEEYFMPFDDKNYNPIYTYRANYKVKDKSLLICNVDILNAWLFKEDSLFNFYLIVKERPDIVNLLSTKFGPHAIETSMEINNVIHPTAYHWDGKYQIKVGEYHNIVDDEKYDSCLLIMFGNMKFQDILRTPD